MVFDGVASPSSRTVGIDVGAPHALDEMEHLVDGDATDRLEYSRRQVHAVQYPGTEGFAGGVESGLHTEAFIDSPARSAELLVRMLRTRVFPLSGAMENELLASLRNARLSPDLRIDAFNDLLAIANRRGSTATLDAEALKAGAELALVVPGVTARRSLWESLLATGSTELVPYLVRGLYADTDSSSRLWILGRLTERFPADARVSEVLDDLSHGSSQVMRVAALRKLGIPNAEEEAALSAAVAAAINDVSLDDLQRLEAVGGLAESAASPGRIPVQLDDRTIRELGVVLMRASRNPAATDVVAKSMAVLGTLQGTAVREVLVEILRRPDQESAGATKASVRALRNSAVGLAATYCRGDAEVRSLLEGLAKGGPGQPPDAFAVMALHSVDKTNDARIFKQGASPR
jgi:hypothetical protein